MRGIEPDNLVEAVNRTKALFVMFGININNREQVYSEVVNELRRQGNVKQNEVKVCMQR